MPVSEIRTGSAPASAGVGLRPAHFEQVLQTRPRVPWLEVHSENFFCGGGEMWHVLDSVRQDYPISLHGVGLSLGSAQPLNRTHLTKLRDLVRRVDPVLVSEHLCWGAVGPRHLNELLPLPYTEESLELMIRRVAETQEFLGRQILIENVSSYLVYRHSTIPESEFLAQLAHGSGAGILLDVNNVYVNTVNHGGDAEAFVRSLPKAAVQEIHLAGFTRKTGLGADLLIDTHNSPVDPAVWQLYRTATESLGAVPTLIEWDQDLPDFGVLLSEAMHAQEIIDEQYPAIA